MTFPVTTSSQILSRISLGRVRSLESDCRSQACLWATISAALMAFAFSVSIILASVTFLRSLSYFTYLNMRPCLSDMNAQQIPQIPQKDQDLWRIETLQLGEVHGLAMFSFSMLGESPWVARTHSRQSDEPATESVKYVRTQFPPNTQALVLHNNNQSQSRIKVLLGRGKGISRKEHTLMVLR